MSYELKMQGVSNGKRSRLYKKTKRASMNKIDATHLPMRVQSDKGGYWSQPSRGSVHILYSKVRKFLMARVGRPVDKVYSEFLQEGSKYAQIRNLQEIFNEFMHQRDNYANRGLKLGGFYVSNGILNYKASKRSFGVIWSQEYLTSLVIFQYIQMQVQLIGIKHLVKFSYVVKLVIQTQVN